MPSSSPICQALNLSDGGKCAEAATVWDDLFCRFHGKQCHGLYAGYKKRNGRLDALPEIAPTYLRDPKTALANDTFESVNDEKSLQEIHAHLFKEYVLLGKVIDARKLHHKHFYPLKLDYGHQAYLDTLSSRRHIVLRALERLEKRTAEVLYEKEKWFRWVREVQQEEEMTRDKEQKKVKLEAAMFKRHWKKMEVRLRRQRQKEEKQQQDAFLEAVYQERMRDASLKDDEDEEMWDPIEDFVEDERGRYIDLIKHFLWLEVLAEPDDVETKETSQSAELAIAGENAVTVGGSQSKKPKKKSKPKSAKATNSSSLVKSGRGSAQPQVTGQGDIIAVLDGYMKPPKEEVSEPDKSNIETEREMRIRLKEGVEKNYDDVMGPVLVGSMELPHETFSKTAPMDDDEVDGLMKDLKEIKLLLFCRLLLSHASLLPSALRCESVEDFLDDPEIAETDLRDICLKVEQPSLQDVRDACADLTRGDEDDDEEDDEDDMFEEQSFEEVILHDRRYGHLQDPDWYIDNMLAQRAKLLGKGKEYAQLFKKPKRQKMRVRICGKNIWNYSSESSMSRDGWLQFSVLAKDCNLSHAVHLCRNWDEFYQLNFLTVWQYFPASNWVSWGSDKLTQQLNELGFFPFFKDFDARNSSRHFQVGGRSRQRRQHDFVEARNIVVGYMKRNDSITRRFLQYCTMRAGDICVLVRDGKTGKAWLRTATPEPFLKLPDFLSERVITDSKSRINKVIIAPTDPNCRWTLRSKQGLGRASKNEWDIMLEVGTEFFHVIEMFRQFRLGFENHYEVWLWDFVPGRDPTLLYNTICEELRKAQRLTNQRDTYNHHESFLRSLTRHRETLRVRSIRPGEQIQSLWDDIQNPKNTFFLANIRDGTFLKSHDGQPTKKMQYMFYNEADAAEDLVLFSDELISPNRNVPFKEILNPITRLETSPTSVINWLAQGARDITLQDTGPTGLVTVETYSPPDTGSELTDDSEYTFDGELEPVRHSPARASYWDFPVMWQSAASAINSRPIPLDRKRQLRRVKLLEEPPGKIRVGGIQDETEVLRQGVGDSNAILITHKDRGAAWIEAFRKGDLEPGGPEKYQETCRILEGIHETATSEMSTSWLWLVVDLIEWLDLRCDTRNYNPEPLPACPHPFIAQDMIKAYASVAMFFPELEESSPVQRFFEADNGAEFRESLLLKTLERSEILPNIRKRTSFKYRPKSFWKEWEEILQKATREREYYADSFPMEWSVAIRPIIAKLYLAGILFPAHLENSPEVVPGFAVANTEPHRPDELDLFIDYADRAHASHYPSKIPGFCGPSDWPEFLPIAREFAAKNSSARFAILCVWSAPHFYPAMMGDFNRQGTAFLDSAARSWMWRFIPKDMPTSEFSMYNNLKLRLDQFKRHLKDRVVHRSEVILVMGLDQLDLLKYATVVTFAIQTKPWFREIDLWKSFVNVDVDFLEGLDPYWLD